MEEGQSLDEVWKARRPGKALGQRNLSEPHCRECKVAMCNDGLPILPELLQSDLLVRPSHKHARRWQPNDSLYTERGGNP